LLSCLFGVPELDRKQHNVDRAYASRIIGDSRVLQVNVPQHAFDLQSLGLDRLEIGVAGNEEDIVPRRCHARAEISADSTGCHHRNAHALSRLCGSYRTGD
jgi:hypothetical protein